MRAEPRVRALDPGKAGWRRELVGLVVLCAPRASSRRCGSQPDGAQDRVLLRLDALDLDARGHGGLRVLEAVSGEYADAPAGRVDLPGADRLAEACHGGGGGRLAEHAFEAWDLPVGFQDGVVRHGVDQAAGF